MYNASLNTDAGWSSLVARRAHNPKVVGSNPAPATNYNEAHLKKVGFFVADYFGGIVMRKDPFGLTELLEPSITAMGYTLWGVEFHANSVNALLRIFIDKESGVSVDDCADVSHQVEGLLDVNDPISTAYTLEVSSPGLDRSFFSIEQMMAYMGSEMDVQLISVVNNRRRFKATLSKIEGENLTFFIPKITGKKGKAARQASLTEGEELTVDYSMLDKVNLSPNFSKK